MTLTVISAIIFALTPLVWRQLQAAPASLYPLPFVVAWLVAVARFEQTRGAVWAGAAGVFLGLGVYTSLAAVIMMPLYAALTIAVMTLSRTGSWRDLKWFPLAFAVTVAPLAVYVAGHPQLFRDTVNAHHLYDANRFNALQGLREMVSWVGLTARSEVYWDYLNPAFLFLRGDVLLLPLIVLIPLGVFQILSAENPIVSRLAVAGFLAAPFAASLTAEPPVPARIIFITPFAATLAAYGVRWLISRFTPRGNRAVPRTKEI